MTVPVSTPVGLAQVEPLGRSWRIAPVITGASRQDRNHPDRRRSVRGGSPATNRPLWSAIYGCRRGKAVTSAEKVNPAQDSRRRHRAHGTPRSGPFHHREENAPHSGTDPRSRGGVRGMTLPVWRFSDLRERVAAARAAWPHQGGSFGVLQPPKTSTLMGRSSDRARLAPFELLWLDERTAGRTEMLDSCGCHSGHSSFAVRAVTHQHHRGRMSLIRDHSGDHLDVAGPPRRGDLTTGRLGTSTRRNDVRSLPVVKINPCLRPWSPTTAKLRNLTGHGSPRSRTSSCLGRSAAVRA
jgi:hypothetical protein